MGVSNIISYEMIGSEHFAMRIRFIPTTLGRRNHYQPRFLNGDTEAAEKSHSKYLMELELKAR